jgi:hypothetical protein
VLAEFHRFMFCNAAVMHFCLGTSNILFTDDIKMWTIHLDILEVFVVLQLKKQRGYVLEQDTESCPSFLFPTN